MTRVTTFAAVLVLAAGAAGQNAPAKADPAAALKAKISVRLEPATVGEALGKVAKAGHVTLVINRTAFEKAGAKDDFETRPAPRLEAKDKPVGEVLTDLLRPLGAEYLAGKDYVEIVPRAVKK